jgi:hypothetical protein
VAESVIGSDWDDIQCPVFALAGCTDGLCAGVGVGVAGAGSDCWSAGFFADGRFCVAQSDGAFMRSGLWRYAPWSVFR